MRGLDYKGNCCNGVYENSNSGHSGSMCTEPCHTFFTICITNYMADIPPDLSREKCLLGYVRTNVLGGNNVNFETLEGFNNVFMFHFNISWPVSYTFLTLVCVTFVVLLLLPFFLTVDFILRVMCNI